MDFLRRTILLVCCTYFLTFVASEKVYTDEFAVLVRGGRSVADELALKYGYVNNGQIGELRDHYLFKHKRVQRRSVLPSVGKHTTLKEELMVEWMEQQHIKNRVKRDFVDETEGATDNLHDLYKNKLKTHSISFRDPEYRGQWYIERRNATTMNIKEAWALGYTGAGVVVSILDDGIELNHPDLSLNYDQQASYDVNGKKKNPAPRYDYGNTNKHGTRCAGEVAMQAGNDACGVGIAFNASIGGVRMLDGDVTDLVEAQSLSHARHHIDIYSASWGPDDDGRTVDGPGKLAQTAFREGVTLGRHGLGAIYVWASGNGGRSGDSCNCDGYANSIYTISISSTSEHGRAPWYLESCASTLATTYSSGDTDEKKVVTTDLHQKCTREHSGTSASAPMAAGIIALTLQARPNLSWRDVQYLVVKTSRRANLIANDWTLNGAGYEVSHLYGFGLMDAKAMVEEATSWKTLPAQHQCEVNVIDKPRTISGTEILRLPISTSACGGAKNSVRFLEHVQAQTTLTFSSRGALTIRLISPKNTESTLLPERRADRRSGAFDDWSFMSTHYWGEEANGTWILEVENTGPASLTGKISHLSLVLFGTESAPQFRHRKWPRSSQDNTDSWTDESWDDPSWNDWESDYSDYEDCHEECWNTGCSGPAANQCYKCKNFRDRFTENCVKYCPPGQYEPIYLHEKCKKCNRNCATCIGPELYDCTSCPTGTLLMDGECLDKCDDGFFADKGDNICHRCDDLCTRCQDSPDNCQRCVVGAVLDDTECKLSCPISYFLISGQCQPCHTSCESCHGPLESDCISCDPDLVHKGRLCVGVDQCGDSWYISVDVHSGEVSRECIACHPTCRTCDGFSYDDCMSCYDDKYLTFGVCEPDCVDGTYRSIDDNRCTNCPDGCRLCINSNICISCEEDMVLDSGLCSEGCGTRLYEYAGECFPCHDLCQECEDGGLTDCTECFQENGDRYLLDGACLPFCPEGYYMNSDNHRCMECHETCRRCNDTQCLECVEEKVKAGKNWVCGESEETDKCDQSCATCTSDEQDQCLSCAANLYKYKYTCLEECPHGLYADEQKSCRLCRPTCKTCNGPDMHNCLSCDSEYLLMTINGQKTCKTHCPERMYKDGSTCKDCHDTCFSCDGPLEGDCITLNWLSEQQMPDRKCVDECEEGTFGDTSDWECLPCDLSCKKCTAPESCTECVEGYTIEGNTCKNVEGCRNDQFTHNNNKCVNCHDTCETCSGPHKSDCLSCTYYRFLNNSRCLEVCPDGFYPEFDLNLCLRCHETCDGCVSGGLSDCLYCRTDLYSFPYNGQSCVESCPEGYYEMIEGSSKMCQQCSPECKDCHDSYWQCISCEDSTFLFQDRCVNACPYEYFEDRKLNLCVQDDVVPFPCPLHCNNCDDWGDCRDCKDNYEPYYGECIPSTSQLCADNEYEAINQHGATVCRSCNESCVTCQGPGDNECLSCGDKEHLNRGMCEALCAAGMYAHMDGGKSLCMACHPSCKTCGGPSPNECTLCGNNMKLRLEPGNTIATGSCHINCPQGTYAIDGGCGHCDPTCGTCDGLTSESCLTCVKGLYHWGTSNNQTCLANCPNGTFHHRPDDSSTDGYECQECHASCKTCFKGTDTGCTSCPSAMNRQGLACVTTCDEGYYADSDRICQRCHDTCELCFGAGSNHCLSCKNDLFLQPSVDGKYCKKNCTQGWFKQPGHKCRQCHPRCLTCIDDDAFSCSSCRDSYMLVNGTCYNRCQLGNYWNKGVCMQCDATCLECYGPKKHHCIDCPNGLLLRRLNVNHSSCVKCCADGEEPDENCCLCNESRDKCVKIGESTKTGYWSMHPGLHTGTIVIGCIIAVAMFFTIFFILQARSHKTWCFKGSYERFPAYYDTKGNQVIMSKQYQHEKINVMSDDEDFYEDIDSEEETD